MRELHLHIDRLDEEGRGVGRAEDRAVHVPGALPGEDVTAHVTHESPHAPEAWAELVQVDRPSPLRVAPLCPASGRCGGCALQHLAYPAQLDEKRRRVERALVAHAGLGQVCVLPVVPAPSVEGYRNKAKLVLGVAEGGRIVTGSWAPHSHQLVDMTGCRIHESPIADVARATRGLLAETGLPVYDERRRRGELRYLVVRANHEGRALAVLVCRTAAPRPVLVRFAERLASIVPAVAGVVMNVNSTTGGAIFGSEDHGLCGAALLTDCVGDVPLVLSARAFFQVNRAQAARLYDAVVLGLSAGTRAIDLYCGVGGIALSAGRAGATIVGVESDPLAVRDARRAAAALALEERVHFIAADAAVGLAPAVSFLGTPDAVIVNPPRKGLALAVREALARLAAPRLIYMSCCPETLSLDLVALHAAGYRCRDLLPFDLMPGTPEVETVAVLQKE